MLKESNPDNLLVKRVTCFCGRKLLVNRKGYDKKTFMCGTCKTYGVEESRKMFLEINAKSDKTIFETNMEVSF